MTLIKECVGIQPFGDVPELVLKIIAANIEAYFKVAAEILPPRDTPDFALDKRRLQYNAGTILKTLPLFLPGHCTKIMGVVCTDIFIPIFSYSYGEAEQGGNFALISLFRLDKNPDGSSPGSALFYERAAKVALHELGHLFNLFHCDEKTCLMHFSGTMDDLDKIPFYLCRYCSAFLFSAS